MTDAIWNSFPQRLRLFLERFYSMPFGLFLLMALAIMILQNGIWVVPNIDAQRLIASDMTQNMLVSQPKAQYLYSSPLGFFLGWTTGAYRSIRAFAGLHFAVFLSGFLVLAYWLRHRYSDDLARSVVLALICVPLSNVLLTWLGMSDVFTFAFGSALALAQSVPALLLAAFLLGLSHFEQGILIALLMLSKIWLLKAPDDRPQFPRAIAILAGIAGAKILMLAYFSILHFNLECDRISYAMSTPLLVFLAGYFRNLVATLFSFHNAYWFAIFAIVAASRRESDSRLLWFLGLTHLIAASVPMVVHDATRVFALLTWPSILATLIYVSQRPWQCGMRQFTLIAVSLSFLLPKLIVWEGQLHATASLYDLFSLLRALGIYDAFAALAPFGAQTPFH